MRGRRSQRKGFEVMADNSITHISRRVPARFGTGLIGSGGGGTD